MNQPEVMTVNIYVTTSDGRSHNQTVQFVLPAPGYGGMTVSRPSLRDFDTTELLDELQDRVKDNGDIKEENRVTPDPLDW